MKNLINNLILVFAFCWVFPVFGNPTQKYILESLESAAQKVGVPAELLKAICQSESQLQADAYNHGDGSPENHAFGVCQVLYKTAVSMGFSDIRCTKDFRNQEKSFQTCKLFGPYTSSYYAAKYLKHQLKRYKNHWLDSVASYNTGTVKICTKGYYLQKGEKTPCTKGLYINWKYVKKVLKYLGEV